MLKRSREYWAKWIGLDQDEKTAKKRMKLRDAKKRQRQEKYSKSKKVGSKAVRNQRRKLRQLKQLHEGD